MNAPSTRRVPRRPYHPASDLGTILYRHKVSLQPMFDKAIFSAQQYEH